MKIVVSSKRFLPMLGGSINYAVMLATSFHSKGNEVIIMTRTSGLEDEINGIPVVRNPSVRRKFQLATWADVILQVDASWQDVWPFLLKGVPWFPTIHNGRVKHFTSIKTELANLGLELAFRLGRTIPVNLQVASDWHINNPPIDNPYDDTLFFPPHEETMRVIDLLFVGRIEASKGVFVLMDALQKIENNLARPLRCVFVGEGNDDARLGDCISEYKGKHQYVNLGRLASHEVATQMRNSKILVFPTTPQWIEASPLAPLEALACGCRIVASDSGGTRDSIGPDGVLVISGDVASLAEAILIQIINPPDRDINRVSKFLKDRTLDRVSEKYLERFRGALN